MLKCGAYEAVITPKLGLAIAGYFETRIADDIIDDLYAKAVIFDDGNKVVGLVVLDILHVTADMTRHIRERFSKITGVDADGIMVAATHSHTSVSIEYDDEFSPVDDDSIAYMCYRSADALVLAYRRREECKIGFGRGEEYDLSFNRRFFMKDGVVRTWPGVANPDNVRPAAPIDPEVAVVRVDKLDGTPISVITNFANHLDIVGGTAYCADYPGELSRCIKKELGEGVVSVFVNGCCGDVTHIDYTGNHPYDKNNHYIKCGQVLAEDVLKIYKDIVLDNDVTVDSSKRVVTIERRQPTEEMYEESKKFIAGFENFKNKTDNDDVFEKPTTGDADKMALSYAKCTVNLYENPVLSENIELQVIRIKDIAFNGMPGEMFAEIGLELKDRSSFDKNINVELANGCYGYIATKKAFSEGGYEVTLDRYVNMSEETADIMNDVLLQLQNELK